RNHNVVTDAPKDFNILGSNDGVNFDVLSQIQNQTGWLQNQRRDFDFVNSNHYRYYRLQILTNNGHANFTTVGEIKFGYNQKYQSGFFKAVSPTLPTLTQFQ